MDSFPYFFNYVAALAYLIVCRYLCDHEKKNVDVGTQKGEKGKEIIHSPNVDVRRRLYYINSWIVRCLHAT